MSRRGENIRKRKDGRWEGRYYMQEPETGRKVSRSVYAKSYGELREKLLAAKKQAETLAVRKKRDSMLSFGEVAEEWLMTIESEKKHATYMKYRTVYEIRIREKLSARSFAELDDDIMAEVFQCNGAEVLSDSLRKSIACVRPNLLKC